MDKFDVAVFRPPPRINQCNQPGKTLTAVYRIQDQGLERAGYFYSVDGCLMRHAIGRSRVTSDDLDIRFAKRGAQYRGGTVTIIDDVSPDALGLRVDVDAAPAWRALPRRSIPLASRHCPNNVRSRLVGNPAPATV